MRKRGLGKDGLIAAIYAGVTAIACGVDWLMEGHLSKVFLYFLLWVWGLLFVTTLLERLDTIRDRVEEIKDQNEAIQKRLDQIERKLPS
jgi:hypothetical protein